MNPSAHLAIALMASFASPQEPVGGSTETGMTGFATFTHTGPGADFLQAGTPTRDLTVPGGCPVSLDLPALPPGAEVVISFLSWSYLTDDIPFAHFLFLNGHPVTGLEAGRGLDLCWGKSNGVSYLAGLDVTPFLDFGASNTVTGVCDGPLGADGNALGEGLTILTIYEIPGGPPRVVDVFTGYTDNADGPGDVAFGGLLFSERYDLGGPLHFFVNALDGEPDFQDDFFINGLAVSGILLGTGVPGNAWQGFRGPTSPGSLYDSAEGDVSLFVDTPFGMFFQTTRPPGQDCIAHTLAAVSFGLPRYERAPVSGPAAGGRRDL